MPDSILTASFYRHNDYPRKTNDPPKTAIEPCDTISLQQHTTQHSTPLRQPSSSIDSAVSAKSSNPTSTDSSSRSSTFATSADRHSHTTYKPTSHTSPSSSIHNHTLTLPSTSPSPPPSLHIPSFPSIPFPLPLTIELVAHYNRSQSHSPSNTRTALTGEPAISHATRALLATQAYSNVDVPEEFEHARVALLALVGEWEAVAVLLGEMREKTSAVEDLELARWWERILRGRLGGK